MASELPTCPYRGKVLPTRCFCRHPVVTGPHTKSVPVPHAQCHTCPVPTGGEPDPAAARSLPTPIQLTIPTDSPPPIGHGPGTELIKIFKRFNAPACQLCYELAARMDGWGVEGCKKRRKQIVDEIMPRFEQWVATGRWKKKIPKGGARKAIGACVRLAIWQAWRKGEPEPSNAG